MFASEAPHFRLCQAVPKTVLMSFGLDAGVAASENAEHVMLRMDDEIAGLIAAAEVPADHNKAHTSQPDAVSPVLGEIPHVPSTSARP